MADLLNAAMLQRLALEALDEDSAFDDITTRATVLRGQTGKGSFLLKEDGVICGLPVVEAVFRVMHTAIVFDYRGGDGESRRAGQVIATVKGPLGPILSAERTALNLLQHLSGVATATARYVEAVRGTNARIVDTRKILPGYRMLDKYAVRCGGAFNHRYHLGDGVLIKDNHLAAIRARKGGSIAQAVAAARQTAHHMLKVEVEVENLLDAREALEAGADVILLDNMATEEMRKAVEMAAGRALLEASGGVTLETVRAIAETGVDLISVGSVTHSSPALDISLDIEADKSR